MNKTIVYRVNADRTGGYGHLGRSIALAMHMENVGYESVFLLGPDVSGASVAFFGATDPVYQLPDGYTDVAEMEAMKQVLDLEKPVAVVVDLLQSSVWMMEMIAKSKIPLLAIDDKFQNNHRADIIVSSNPVATDAKYKDNDAELLLGCKYILLRPQFALAAQEKSDDAWPFRMYVSFGGSDPNNYTLRLVDTLGNIKADVRASIVVGSGYYNYDFLLETASGSMVKADIRQGEKEPWILMKGARLAICSIGNTLWELMCMSVPCIVLTQNDNQAQYADELAERYEVIIHFARNNDFKDDELAKVIDELLGDDDKRNEMATKGRKLVDGQGVERVAKALIRKMESV